MGSIFHKQYAAGKTAADAFKKARTKSLEDLWDEMEAWAKKKGMSPDDCAHNFRMSIPYAGNLAAKSEAVELKPPGRITAAKFFEHAHNAIAVIDADQRGEVKTLHDFFVRLAKLVPEYCANEALEAAEYMLDKWGPMLAIPTTRTEGEKLKSEDPTLQEGERVFLFVGFVSC